MSELLPCPFCDSKDIDITETEVSWNTLFWATCGNEECGAAGPVRDARKSAINAWNIRVTEIDQTRTIFCAAGIEVKE